MDLPVSETQSAAKAIHLRKLTKYETALALLFVLTLPLCNPWVRGDGVGYYAFARSMLIEHRLDFANDWLHANASFRMGRIDPEGHINAVQYTATGHLDNHFSVGPAILWSPFLLLAHAGVLLYDHFGGEIAADGFSAPYLVAMALGTALYGFLAVLISFSLARRLVPESWAFLAALGIWFGSPLPVYMYFNPSWSHAQAAFAVALFLWYWIRTRGGRSWRQWAILGALGGLMLDVYYVSGILLLLPLMESIGAYWSTWKKATSEPPSGLQLFIGNILFAAALLAAFLPTLIAKHIIYGSYLKTGYDNYQWSWNSPAFLKVCFSADHGLFSWNPILILAAAGLVCLRKYDRTLSLYSIIVLAVFLYVIGCYPDWDGISSFGNRFFVPLASLFILGLAAFFDWFARVWQEHRPATYTAVAATAILVLWNLGLIFQWGLHWIPQRGPISWRTAAYNQVTVVPEEAVSILKTYATGRRALMNRIEQRDVQQLRQSQGAK
jgi:hypothetical protein